MAGRACGLATVVDERGQPSYVAKVDVYPGGWKESHKQGECDYVILCDDLASLLWKS